MQINKINEFVITAENSQRKAPQQINNSAQKNFDYVSISDVAKRLNVNLQKSSLTNKINKIEDAPVLSKTAEKIDKIMKKAVDILERIQNLTVLAQDKNLTDSDRIEIQIEIEELRDNFDILPRNLITGENNSSRIDFDKKFNIEIQSADGSSILERMRERINNGEKWDVREAYSPLGFIRIKQNEDGEEIYEIYCR